MNFILKYQLLFFFLWGFTFSAIAQSDEIQIKVYGIEEGLSHRSVFKIIQDKKGFIWLATERGINRFDGTSFLHYSNKSRDNFIPINRTIDMLIDTNYILYLNNTTQLTQLNTETGAIDIIIPQENSKLADKKMNIQAITLNEQQDLWMSVASGKEDNLLQIKSDNYLKDVFAFAHKGEKSIASLNDNVLVEFNPDTLLRLNAQSKQAEYISTPQPEEIVSLFTTAQKQIWILYADGKVYYKKLNDTDFILHPISESLKDFNKLNTLFVEKHGDVWIGGVGHLWHFDAKLNTTLDYGERIQQITRHTTDFRNIFQDQQDVIWVSSEFGAIKMVKPSRMFAKYLNDNILDCQNKGCSMRGITGDGAGNIYFSYYNSIQQLNTQTGKIKNVFPNRKFENRPFGLLYHDEHLWTGNGLKLDLKRNRVDTIFSSKRVGKGHVIAQDDKTLWFAYEKKLYEYNTSKKTLTTITEDVEFANQIKSEINYLHKGKYKDYTWLGTQSNGVFALDTNKQIALHFNADSTSVPQLNHNRIIALYEDNQANLWMATANGLHCLHIPSEELKIYTTKEGLPNNFINGVLSEADSCMWVSTDNGLSRLDVKNQNFINFYVEDGLSANEFNRVSFYKAHDGQMFFGGLQGVNTFYPEELTKKEKEKHQAPVLFTGLAKFDASVDSLITQKKKLRTDSTIGLTHNDRFFTIEYALADYTNPLTTRYSYMLEGYEKEWSDPSSTNQARYFNIPPGDYTFRVKAAFENGKWNKEELAIPIHIQQAFYKTWWFLLLSILLASTLMYLLFRYRIYSIEKRKIQLENEVTLRTKELAQEKQKSDELLLNILPAGMAEELKTYGKAKAKRHETVTVFFSDFKDFSKIAASLSPEDLVAEIDRCFRAFDEIIDMYGLEKIKTIGDAYMCAGMPKGKGNNAKEVVQAALEIQAYMNALAFERKEKNEIFFEARIGIHTGSVVAGIVGIKKFAYDIWGDTVNIAARMEGNGEVGKVNISATTHELVKDDFECTHRGKIDVKNKGMVDMYFVEGRKKSRT